MAPHLQPEEPAPVTIDEAISKFVIAEALSYTGAVPLPTLYRDFTAYTSQMRWESLPVTYNRFVNRLCVLYDLKQFIRRDGLGSTSVVKFPSLPPPLPAVDASTSFVHRFLSLTSTAAESLTEDGLERVYPERRAGFCTPVQDLAAAFVAFMTKCHNGHGHSENMDKATLIKAGFRVEEKNMCKACRMYALKGHRCCASYKNKARSKCSVVFDVVLVREVVVNVVDVQPIGE
jgi:hypothetical protein